MTSVRQFAEGLMQYVRSALGADEGQETQAALEAEREAVRQERVAQQIAEFKRKGLLRATERSEALARVLLHLQETNVVLFGGQETPVARLFAQFLEANGAVVPMGELARAGAGLGAGASDRLIAMAQEAARRDHLSYLAAFAQVSAAHPELAHAAREEGLEN